LDDDRGEIDRPQALNEALDSVGVVTRITGRSIRGESMVRYLVGIVIVLVFAASAGARDETLGEILGKGAKKMSGAESKAVLTRGRVSGPNESGQWVDASYNPDGTIDGIVAGISFSGEWNVDDEGQMCVSLAFRGGTFQGCYFHYKLGERIYRGQADRPESDGGQVVLERKINPR
jgi:hypothetical protein